MPWFVKLEEGVVDKARFDAVVPAHLQWLESLARAGRRGRGRAPAPGGARGGPGGGGGGPAACWCSRPPTGRRPRPSCAAIR
jgi:hypothetical protein